LRIEFGPDIGVTIVTPGLIDSEMTQGKFLPQVGSSQSICAPLYAAPRKYIVNQMKHIRIVN